MPHFLKAFKYYLNVYAVQIKNNFVREVIYRTNFLTAIIIDIVWMGVEISLFSVIYANVPVVAGWSREQVFFFLGIFFSADSLFTIFFQRNFWTFSDLVNKGDLDILLTKPIEPIFLVLSRSIHLTAFLNLVLGLTISLRFAKAAGFMGGWYWLLLPFWLVVGLLTAVLIRFSFCIWVFWTERSAAFSRLYYAFFNFAGKPDSFYPPFLRYMVLTILPFAFIGSVPARALLFGLNTGEYALLACVLFLFFLFNRSLWRAGLKRYQSASS